ncbi:LiaF transmembrane domain-containing protein [Mucilaginibacter limnophilus]|nr:LiaF domain-containing protein [Mucilaginibacter limnophilus]
MNNNINYKKDPQNGKVIAGGILLVVGGVLLLRQLDLFFFPGWLFSWPMWLIIPGIYIGAKSNFQKSAWFVLVLLGVAFLIQEAVGHDANKLIWPGVFIAFGMWMILRRNNKYDQEKWRKFEQGSKKQPVDFTAPVQAPVVDYTVKNEDEPVIINEPAQSSTRHPYNDDYLDAVAIFGGVDRIIVSKSFKGGEIVNIFGGSEIDFTKADIQGQVILEITQVFGGTKLIIPPHWHVISDVSSIFAGVDDKRMRHTTTINNEKVLVIKGVSIFAGIDIRSY